ncbi:MULTISPECIES: prephenate dehydrogenase/arogenate dehydrogenase family protein [Thioalkalivibrio]|uniref:prephenate dehydrogenase n=1 Tax=Thioalkalivibrio TaxID=106633 RepID=UPI0003723329|nr:MULTISPECIES: prephenate dehydrogenase/arogenate dehydrogenase family protein [Thioalkalivibrio]OOC48366.1 prephenate dehydrogenase [Thioalkalivibrio versutus]
MIERLVIFGVGLIGGSLALALREAGAVREIVGCSRNADNLREAQRLGVIDRWTTDVAEAAEGADLGVLAVPLGAMEPLARDLAAAWPEDSPLTDVGSSKQAVIDAVGTGFGKVPRAFVPGHPIAGTEKSGVGAAFATLFRERLVILTPVDATNALATDRVAAMWQAAGARVEYMTPAHHDRVLAATSHLPHVLAFTLVSSLANMSERDEIFHYAAGGFRDFTRIASSDPVVWRDICLANRTAILEVIGQYQADLEGLRSAIEHGDAATIEQSFEHAKETRDRLCDPADAQLDT